MGRIIFGDDGKPVGIDGAKNSELQLYEPGNGLGNGFASKNKGELKTSSSLEFLKEREGIGDIFSRDYWSLHSDGEKLDPLKFTNGKTQEDIVREMAEALKEHKVIFLHGTCGSGKSAIALNLARVMGKSSIVVPVKALQKQYEEDYITRKYLIGDGGKKMKIAMITGKDNHDSIIQPGVSCADPFLPENIKIVERNSEQILEYVKENPFLNNPEKISFENVRRMTIAASNPYWSPLLPATFELKVLTDARKRKYKGVGGEDYVFYHRKKGCSYYDQYLAYMDADVIIFNSAKYKAELSIGRKPLTEVDIIDEADEFLDSFFQQDELNLTRLLASLKIFRTDSLNARKSLEKIREWIGLEEKNKMAVGIQEDQVFHISETKIKSILEEFNSNMDLESEIALDELNYANKALETAQSFKNSLDSLYLTYRKNEDDNILIKLVSTDISGKFRDLLNKTKKLVFMSGTLHSENIIKNIFGIEDFKVIQAEESNFGSIEIVMTGKEFDCSYANFSSKKYSRIDYLDALSECIHRAKTPALVHVHAFKDLPTEEETHLFELNNLISSERIRKIQKEDKTGSAISDFKKGLSDFLFSTKCSRGVDFPGETCNSIVFTKYPNPNVSDTFWKVLQKTHPDYYWEFYKDKAWREFLQRIYRALRSPDDHVLILSPDKRVLDSVRKLQMNGF
ncbi:MAG TPA: hypothetical protein ENH99_00020 [Candidatus Pacearchaeota archaeon]|nr:hypothetical protein [Candidatus Pacearchaeota archaeon]